MPAAGKFVSIVRVACVPPGKGKPMGLPLQTMSVADFLTWEAQQPTRHEFFRGEVFAMTGGSARHNRVILNLAARLSEHLDGTSCQVFAESMKVRLADEAVLYPDVMVSCGSALAGDEQVVTDPTLIIEVLSPSTMGYDKRNKFILYRGLPTLREYALIDPASREIEVFTLTADGWLLTDQTTAAELTLASIECRLPMAAVFKGVA
ncbi:MAG: Uma2 family endonuclease [Burkholderiaceae bacterium]